MNIIACVDRAWGIGFSNKLLFDLVCDKKHFVAKTLYKAVVMGYNTWMSLPVRPLRDRHNIVLTHRSASQIAEIDSIQNVLNTALDGRDKALFCDDDFVDIKGQSVVLVDSVKMLQQHLSCQYRPRDIFVIGGQSVYQQLLPFCSHAYITHVDKVVQADRHMVDISADREWALSGCESSWEHGMRIDFCQYRRVVFAEQNS